jgi:hypothetical protein
MKALKLLALLKLPRILLDPTTEEATWLVVRLKPSKKLKKPIYIAQIKADTRFK